jgi:hypothetical protein
MGWRTPQAPAAGTCFNYGHGGSQPPGSREGPGEATLPPIASPERSRDRDRHPRLPLAGAGDERLHPGRRRCLPGLHDHVAQGGAPDGLLTAVPGSVPRTSGGKTRAARHRCAVRATSPAAVTMPACAASGQDDPRTQARPACTARPRASAARHRRRPPPRLQGPQIALKNSALECRSSPLTAPSRLISAGTWDMTWLTTLSNALIGDAITSDYLGVDPPSHAG